MTPAQPSWTTANGKQLKCSGIVYTSSTRTQKPLSFPKFLGLELSVVTKQLIDSACRCKAPKQENIFAVVSEEMNKLFTNIAISYLSYLPTSKSRVTKPCLFGCANTNNYDSIFNFPKLCSSSGTSRVISLRQPYFDSQVICRIIPNLEFLGSTEDAISSSPSL